MLHTLVSHLWVVLAFDAHSQDEISMYNNMSGWRINKGNTNYWNKAVKNLLKLNIHAKSTTEEQEQSEVYKTQNIITWIQTKKRETQQYTIKYQIQLLLLEEMKVIQFVVRSLLKDKSRIWALLLVYVVMETLLVVLMLSIQSNGLKLHIGCSISTYISITQVFASKGNKQCNVINAVGMRTTKFLSILKEYCWMKQKCTQTFTHQQEYIIQDSGYQSLIRKAYPQAKQKFKKEIYIYQKGKEKNVTLKTFYKIFSHMQGILSSNNDNLSNIAALLNGKSACTTIRFERGRILSDACILSAGRALTRGDRFHSHGKWSILWEATASRYGLGVMEKMSGRSEDSRARFYGKRERVERDGRYGRERVSENEMSNGQELVPADNLQQIQVQQGNNEVAHGQIGKEIVLANVNNVVQAHNNGGTGKEMVPVNSNAQLGNDVPREEEVTNGTANQYIQTSNKFAVLEVQDGDDTESNQVADVGNKDTVNPKKQLNPTAAVFTPK
ncbi:hypothetical protein A4A49_65492, partial [Nicotiana attenuata]